MNQMDILYRAFLDYRKSTLEEESCAKMRHAIVRAAADRDKVESQRSICTIEEDWVCAIEEGLPFVEKAIREERQFIRQRGEVIPIEKVRRVSKASVAHLARHSDLITRVPEEGEDLIPDELYMVENLTNYAVYENRFLYMLLCYLRDFIDLRYNQIVERGNTYKANMTMAKTVTIGKRTITYNTQFTDEYRNDPLSSLDQKARDMIRRIEDLQNVVAMLLATPLMKEVGHVPMLKPPITRTNALRMDNALRKSLALYDYVSSYNKEGYSVDVVRKTFSPLPEVMADEFSETISLTSFLVYEYSNNLKAGLKEEYAREEIRRRDEEAEKRRQQMLALRRKIAEEGVSPEEYMLQLEERNRYLESLRTELDQANEKIEKLTEENARMQESIHNYEIRVGLYEEEIKSLVARYESEIQEMLARHAEEIAELKERHAREIAEMEARHKLELEEMERIYKEEMEMLRMDLLGQLTDLRIDYEARLERMREDFESEAAARMAAHEDAMAELAARHEADLAAAEERRASEVSELETRYETDMAAAEERRVSEVTELETRYETDMAAAEERRLAEIAELEERRANDMAASEEWYKKEMDALNKRYDEDVTELKDKYDNCVQTYEATITEMRDDYEEQVTVLGERACNAENELYDLREKHILQRAELRALRHQRGTDTNEDDFTSEERFKELVEELATLDAFVGAHWKKAKRRIRHRYLWDEEES